MAPYGLPQFCTTNEEADSVNKNTMIVNDDTDLEANNLPSDEDPHPRTPIHCRDCAYCKWFIFAERCYRIQSKTLHIPDKYGWVSPGPPRRQVMEVTLLMYAVGAVLLTALCNAADVVDWRGESVLKMEGIWEGIGACAFIFFLVWSLVAMAGDAVEW